MGLFFAAMRHAIALIGSTRSINHGEAPPQNSPGLQNLHPPRLETNQKTAMPKSTSAVVAFGSGKPSHAMSADIQRIAEQTCTSRTNCVTPSMSWELAEAAHLLAPMRFPEIQYTP